MIITCLFFHEASPLCVTLVSSSIKHIDLTITLEQHSPAPQAGYLSPGGPWSDKAGSELSLCLTPPMVFAPPLVPFPVHLSFLFFTLCPSCAPPSAPIQGCPLQQAKDICCPSLVLCRHGTSSKYPAQFDEHPCILSHTARRDAPEGVFLQELSAHQW